MSHDQRTRQHHRIPGEPPGGRQALFVWGIGILVYVVAVIHRSSLGVAGIDAADRFGIGASVLSTFSILQVLVYAGMQIPVGLLVDRFGTKRVLSLGIVLFTAGQLGFALSHSFVPALVARGVLGCGDAMTFVSVLRLGTVWFPARRAPLVSQCAGLFGMAGNLVSTILLARLLHTAGWTPTFVGTAIGGAAALVLVVLFLKDRPRGHVPPPSAEKAARRPLRRQIAAAWREPGTRLGLWVHFTTQFSGMFFLLLWGMPFLVEAEGLSRETAGLLLTVVVVSNMVFGVVFGQIIARHHNARMPLALGAVALTALAWAAVLGWPADHAPMWLLVTHAVVLGTFGPASMIGFDFARPANPPERLGTASGIVNMGGFIASMIMLLTVGVLLDLVDGGSGAAGGPYSPHAYHVAFCSIFVLQALGVSQILRLRRRAARRERERVIASRVETVHVPATAG